MLLTTLGIFFFIFPRNGPSHQDYFLYRKWAVHIIFSLLIAGMSEQVSPPSPPIPILPNRSEYLAHRKPILISPLQCHFSVNSAATRFLSSLNTFHILHYTLEYIPTHCNLDDKQCILEIETQTERTLLLLERCTKQACRKVVRCTVLKLQKLDSIFVQLKWCLQGSGAIACNLIHINGRTFTL